MCARVLENIENLCFGFRPSPWLAKGIRDFDSDLHLFPEKAGQRVLFAIEIVTHCTPGLLSLA